MLIVLFLVPSILLIQRDFADLVRSFKRIFLTNDGEVNLITNSTLTKSFLISTKKTEYKNLDKDSNQFEKYEAKARLNLINKIYQSYDESVNQKYKVELNQRTIDRVKNSF